jgi:maltose O-acetyltransferase
MSDHVSLMSFLKFKLKNISIWEVLYLEIEGLLYWPFKNIPGVIGFFSRNFIISLFSKNKNGMVWSQSEINFSHLNKITFGSNVGINSGSYINGVGGIDFGNYVLIGSNVTISSGEHPIKGRSPSIYSRPTIPKKIIIEDDVWIAAGAVILPGVTLSVGTVVGANSVVTKSTEPYSVMVGAPARKVKTRE